MRALYHHRTQGRGVEAVHISGIVLGLRRNGCEVLVVGPPGVDVDPEVLVYSEKGRTGTLWGLVSRHTPQLLFELLEIGYNLVAVPRLLAACLRWRPDLIYERYAGYNLAGVLVGRLARIPVIVEVNDLASEDRTRQGKRTAMLGLAQACERAVFRRASGVAPVSGYLRGRILEMGAAADRVRAIPNAVDPERFDPERVSGAEVRARHGLADRPVIGYVGAFTKWHRLDLLIQVSARLHEEFPGLRLLLVGDGARRPEVESLVAELSLGDFVVFAGKVPHGEIPAHVAAMDLAVVPGANEFVSPVKAFEYMAMGRPVVAPRYHSLEEAVEHGRSGLLFEPDNPGALYSALRRLLAEPGLRSELGRAAREKVLARHLWQHNARAVLELAGLAGGQTARRETVGAGEEPGT